MTVGGLVIGKISKNRKDGVGDIVLEMMEIGVSLATNVRNIPIVMRYPPNVENFNKIGQAVQDILRNEIFDLSF